MRAPGDVFKNLFGACDGELVCSRWTWPEVCNTRRRHGVIQEIGDCSPVQWGGDRPEGGRRRARS